MPCWEQNKALICGYYTKIRTKNCEPREVKGTYEEERQHPRRLSLREINKHAHLENNRNK